MTLDFSNASEEVQDVKTLLQKLLNKFYSAILYLFKSGVSDSSHFISWVASSSAIVTTTAEKIRLFRYGATYCSVITEKIDITNYSKLVLDYGVVLGDSSVSGARGGIKVGICQSNTPSSNSDFVHSINIDYEGGVARTQKSLDLSAYSGEYYIKIFHGGRASDNAWDSRVYADVYNCYIE